MTRNQKNAAAAMKAAWETARKAAAETGKKASLFFRAALKMAWAEIQKTCVKFINKKLQEAGINATANEWQERRIYINIHAEKGLRGNATTKIYVDIATAGLVISRGKGLTSREFDAALEQIQAMF